MKVNKMRALSVLLIFCFLFSAVAFSAQKTLTDDQIYDNVRRRLANDPDVKGGTFQVDVKDGVVTVKGVVERQKQKDRAESIIKKTKGVTGVNNQIQIKPAGLQ
jgi:osmotically-inducible protein OsmY